MNAQIPRNISDFTARNISIKQLRKWSETGEQREEELSALIRNIRVKLHNSTSPSKIISLATKSLQKFFSQKDTRGEVNTLNSRHIEFKLVFPKLEEGGLEFCLIYGEINARTKACKFDQTIPVRISAHALQRLLIRLESGSDEAALDEIYSCIKLAIPWHHASTITGAQCWPLISEHGFFVGVPNPNSLVTTLITWMRDDGLSQKWLEPLTNLKNLKKHNAAILANLEFAQEFLFSFPWMLKEHVPGVDIASIAWESKDFDTSSDDLLSHEESDNNHETKEWEHKPALHKKKSASYLPGINYSSTPPPFKIYTQHKGIVVQKREDGIRIVGLKNGWVGKIPPVSIERGIHLIEGYKPPEIGDEVEVSVQKIKRWVDEEAYLISVDQIEVANAHWNQIEGNLPIGSEISGIVNIDLKTKYSVQLSDGNRGLVDKSEVLAYLQSTNEGNINPINLEFDFKVTGYSPTKKNILLSIPNLTKIQKNAIANQVQLNHFYSGTCIKVAGNYCVMQLENGYTGMLHKNNCWGISLPNLGESIQVKVIYLNLNENDISFSGTNPQSNSEYFDCLPMTPELWKSFTDKYKAGDTLRVQVREWLEGCQGFIVIAECGIRGLINKKEMSRGAEDIDILKETALEKIFQAKILKINEKKKNVSFSKRMAEPHPLDDPEIAKIKGRIYSGQVTSVVDYGCFIFLPLLQAEGLLHKTKIPEGVALEKSEHVSVCIEDLDFERKRISLSLVSTQNSAYS